MKVAFYYFTGMCGFFIGFILSLIVSEWVFAFLCQIFSDINITMEITAFIYSISSCFFGITVAVCFSYFFMRKYKQWTHLQLEKNLGRKILLGIILSSYLLTWLIGGPFVQTQHRNWISDEMRKISNRDPQVWQNYPHARTYLVFPIAPLVLVSYHEYQIHQLYGWGGWEFYFWYGFGAKSIGIALWVS